MNFEGPLADIFGGPDVAQYRVLVRKFDLILSERGFHYDFLTCWLIEIFAGKSLQPKHSSDLAISGRSVVSIQTVEDSISKRTGRTRRM